LDHHALSYNDNVLQSLYDPRRVFWEYHLRKQRYALTVAHRRSGKTVCAIGECIERAMITEFEIFPPKIAFIAPTYAQVKRNAWSYLKHYTSNIPGVKYSENELSATFPNGAMIFLAGSDNPDTLRGLYLDHAVLDEFGSCDPTLWGSVVRPALSDRKGGATFIGSANGRNHFYDLYAKHKDDPDWLVTVLRASETGILDDAELADARETMSPDQYAQEYECNFDAAVTGTFYGQLIAQAEHNHRVTNVPYDPAVPVYAAFDLGIGGATAMWLYQLVGQEIRFIWYYENSGAALTHYTGWLDELKAKSGIRVGQLNLPHDANAREMTTGSTRKEFFESMGYSCLVLPRDNVSEGISAVALHIPKMWFDSRNCAQGIDCLRMYRRSWDEKRKAFSETPLHDQFSHGADAMRMAVRSLSLIGTPSDWKKPLRRNLRVVV